MTGTHIFFTKFCAFLLVPQYLYLSTSEKKSLTKARREGHSRNLCKQTVLQTVPCCWVSLSSKQSSSHRYHDVSLKRSVRKWTDGSEFEHNLFTTINKSFLLDLYVSPSPSLIGYNLCRFSGWFHNIPLLRQLSKGKKGDGETAAAENRIRRREEC